MKKQARMRNIEHDQSKSLWNVALSPGWTIEEVSVLKKALQKLGIGKWRKIVESQCLPGKAIGQIYMQTQRLMGQQSLGGINIQLDFMGLQIDIEKVFLDNMQKKNVVRKNNTVINSGDNPTKEERARRIIENQKLYGLTHEQIKEIKIPIIKDKLFSNLLRLEEVIYFIQIESDKFTTMEKILHLENLKLAIQKKVDFIVNKKVKIEEQAPVILNLEKINENHYKILE